MNGSRRLRRMGAHHKRHGGEAELNLVSLMDIFTILVFFLLVNSTDAESLPSTKSIKLPESIAQQKPKETLVIIVTEKDIVVQGRKIETIASIIDAQDDIIAGLNTELEHHANRSKTIAPGKEQHEGEITIMGDRNIPYKLLKKIMVTCVNAKYTNISLAVMEKTKDKV
ncbi:MAG TPA: biopolymer transporter ExbD [Gammaproteobacteria bacterium]